MIYLSSLLLDPRSAQVQAELRDRYQMHRTLARGFGTQPGQFAAARCLFRVDRRPDSDDLQLLVQSLTQPNWQSLAGRHYLAASPQVKAFMPAFTEGERLRFRLQACPTRRLPAHHDPERADGRRVALYGEREQRAWLERKGKDGGFIPCAYRVACRGLVTSRQRADAPARHLCVDYDGLLEVTDPERLAQTLRSGIGPAKGFGFGLLSLARR